MVICDISFPPVMCAKKPQEGPSSRGSRGTIRPFGAERGRLRVSSCGPMTKAGLFSQPCILSCHGISKWSCASSRLLSHCLGQHTTTWTVCQGLCGGDYACLINSGNLANVGQGLCPCLIPMPFYPHTGIGRGEPLPSSSRCRFIPLQG